MLCELTSFLEWQTARHFCHSRKRHFSMSTLYSSTENRSWLILEMVPFLATAAAFLLLPWSIRGEEVRLFFKKTRISCSRANLRRPRSSEQR